jgi:hypothetical protein
VASARNRVKKGRFFAQKAISPSRGVAPRTESRTLSRLCALLTA